MKPPAMKKKIPDPAGKRKGRRFKIRLAVLLAVLAAVAAAAVFPAGTVWNRVFTFFGLRDFSAGADSVPCSVHVLDVGKADSILVECGGRNMLVDGGTADRGASVAAYPKRRGVKELELVVNTHPDSDHIGGLAQILQEFPVKRYFAPGIPQKLIPSTEEYQSVQKILKQKGLAAEHPSAGQKFSLGGLRIQVLGPAVPGNSTNNNSIVLKLSYGKIRFLLMGDAEKEEEQSLLDSGRSLSADVLKVGHHGSSTSTAQKFLDEVRPRFAAVSVGEDSSSLPKFSVLRRLYRSGVTVYRTDVSGTLIFLTDGKSLSVKTEK